MQSSCEVLEVLLGVDGPDWVVGRVDHDGLGALVDGGGDGGHVDLEGLGIGHDLDARGARSLDPDAVLGEVRGNDDDLVAGVDQRVEADGERGGGTAGEVRCV